MLKVIPNLFACPSWKQNCVLPEDNNFITFILCNTDFVFGIDVRTIVIPGALGQCYEL